MSDGRERSGSTRAGGHAWERLRRSAGALTFSWIAAALGVACMPDANPGTPPLRPLLYTEAPTDASPAFEGYEEWTTPGMDPVAWPSLVAGRTSAAPAGIAVEASTTPEVLLRNTIAALLANDRKALRSLTFDAESLSRTARVNLRTATEQTEGLREDLDELLASFDPGPPSRARPGGLADLLELGPVKLGRPRRLDGSAPKPNEAPSMFWGNEVQVRLRGTNAVFTLRVPRILVGDDGQWRLYGKPELDARFHTWRRMGLHLKSELMQVEHAALPLSVGTYWHYRVRRPAAGRPEGGTGEAWGEYLPHGYRDEVTQVTSHGAWRLVQTRRVPDNPAESPEAGWYLVTPLHVYRCLRDCRARIQDAAWLLAWASGQVPVLVDPLVPGTSWGAGGGDRNPIQRVEPTPEDIQVAAGTFPAADGVTRSTPMGRETAFFVRGVGWVMRRTVSSVETRVEELIEFRIMQ